ncbi:hypothetical protein EVG20_g4280 [Dentipellis fragilis]|uniref:Uncharacterized protein n=1 Tax=Dentipellis fragilis TaxID=205917 RepID=A0A4Y9YYW2_9AGAM|nr:hypothetical protein EVG20_g4280 [Dentipellis fragilis]
MSFATARTALRFAARPAVRPFVSAPRFEGQSSRCYSSNHNNDPEILEREKRRSLSGHPYQQSAPNEDAPGWNESLATDAEADVKADRSSASMDDLVDRTVSHLKAKHSSEERLEASEALSDRDEINGPLRGASSGPGSMSLEVDTYEEEVDKVDGEWHRVTRETRGVVKDV